MCLSKADYSFDTAHDAPKLCTAESLLEGTGEGGGAKVGLVLASLVKLVCFDSIKVGDRRFGACEEVGEDDMPLQKGWKRSTSGEY